VRRNSVDIRITTTGSSSTLIDTRDRDKYRAAAVPPPEPAAGAGRGPFSDPVGLPSRAAPRGIK